MISYQEAIKIAENRIPSDCALFLEETIEKSYGWYFCFQSKEYIETGNISEMLLGNGGFLVEKENGNVIEFGSAYSPEKNFEIYEKGFLIEKLDLVITKVFDLRESVRLLHRLHLTYFEPEFAAVATWKTPKIYNEKQIKDAVSKLPCVFKNQNFYFRYDEFQKIEKSKCFEYELRKSQK